MLSEIRYLQGTERMVGWRNFSERPFNSRACLDLAVFYLTAMLQGPVNDMYSQAVIFNWSHFQV